MTFFVAGVVLVGAGALSFMLVPRRAYRWPMPLGVIAGIGLAFIIAALVLVAGDECTLEGGDYSCSASPLALGAVGLVVSMLSCAGFMLAQARARARNG